VASSAPAHADYGSTTTCSERDLPSPSRARGAHPGDLPSPRHGADPDDVAAQLITPAIRISTRRDPPNCRPRSCRGCRPTLAVRVDCATGNRLGRVTRRAAKDPDLHLIAEGHGGPGIPGGIVPDFRSGTSQTNPLTADRAGVRSQANARSAAWGHVVVPQPRRRRTEKEARERDGLPVNRLLQTARQRRAQMTVSEANRGSRYRLLAFCCRPRVAFAQSSAREASSRRPARGGREDKVLGEATGRSAVDGACSLRRDE